MLQLKKLRSSGIPAIFFQCCSFMIEAQVLMTVSDFSGFFSRNYFLKGGFTFQWRFQLGGGASFLSGRGGHPMGGIGFDGGSFLEKS